MVPWFAPTVTSTQCYLPGWGATGPRCSNGIGVEIGEEGSRGEGMGPRNGDREVFKGLAGCLVPGWTDGVRASRVAAKNTLLFVGRVLGQVCLYR